ncbi:MAG TPA: hypothetical protein VN030_02370 [Cellvibrio sp.]|nr:hypothetical protein [Cellvibrio sp.]
MFNSTVLEVAIGLIFCYASIALITSSIYEAIASWLNLRAATLLCGIAALLNAKDEPGQALLLSIYNNALAHPTGTGSADSIKAVKNKPSYIPAKNFALALIDSIQSAPGKFSSLSDAINAVKDDQLRALLTRLHNRAADNLEGFQLELAKWFDEGMGRVSGAYKKQSQLWCFVIALVISLVLNIDSIHLFKTLWLHSSSVAQINIATASAPLATSAYEQLQALPIGWNNGFSLSAITASMAFGWLISASASLFGAPFWFDLLKTVVRLRGTGTKPDTDSDKNKQTPIAQ